MISKKTKQNLKIPSLRAQTRILTIPSTIYVGQGKSTKKMCEMLALSIMSFHITAFSFCLGHL